jgi:preprotein translocase subunit YajC
MRGGHYICGLPGDVRPGVPLRAGTVVRMFCPFAIVTLLADAADPAAAPTPPEFLKTLINTLPLALIAVAAYLLLFRPEQERRRRQQDLLGGLKKNDRVVTTAGIYGTVANVERDADRVVLKIDDAANVKITVTLSSIARVLGDEKSEARTGRDES